MSVVASRLVLFTLLPVFTAALYVRVEGRALTRPARAEVRLVHLLAFSGASGISGLIAHTALADATASAIGWPSGSPFQHEVAVANLTLAVLAFVAISRTGGFRDATVLAVVVFGLGATATHIWDIVQNANWAAGNSLQNIANLLRPALLVLALRASRHLEPGLISSQWHASVATSAIWSMACAGTAFGFGYGIGDPVLGAGVGAAGALLASWLLAIRARSRPPEDRTSSIGRPTRAQVQGG